MIKKTTIPITITVITFIIPIVIVISIFGITSHNKTNISHTSDMSAYNISNNLRFQDMSFYEFNQRLENNTIDGIFYIGFSTCPWCQEAVPIINNVAEELNINKIYYINKHSDENKANQEWEAKATELILEFVELRDHEGSPRIFVPEVLVFSNGEYIGRHNGTLTGHDSRERNMTTQEKSDLAEIYYNLFRKVK